MVVCVVVNCGNRGMRDKDKHFYRLPAIITREGPKTEKLSEERRRAWLAAINRAEMKAESYPYVRVCSDHFHNGKPAALYDSTNPDWVPSLKLGYGEGGSNSSLARHDRAEKRGAKRKKMIEENEVEEELEEELASMIPYEPVNPVELLQEELERTKDDLKNVHTILSEVQQELCNTRLNYQKDLCAIRFGIDAFKNSDGLQSKDEKVCFYTGLPNWDILSKLFTYLEPHLKETSRTSLTHFNKL